MKKFPYFITFSVTLLLLTCVSIGYLLSTIIVSANLFQSTERVDGGQNTYYLLSIFSSPNLSEVQAEVAPENYADYVYKEGETYHLIVSCHKNQGDAELVKNSLTSSGKNLEILKIKKENITIEGNFSAKEEDILKNSILISSKIFDDLYDLSVSIDTGLDSEITAKLKVNEIYSNFLANKNNFETLFEPSSLAEIEMVKDNYEKIDVMLCSLSQEPSLSKAIKNLLVTLAVEC